MNPRRSQKFRQGLAWTAVVLWILAWLAVLASMLLRLMVV